jgi:hypothetical protein
VTIKTYADITTREQRIIRCFGDIADLSPIGALDLREEAKNAFLREDETEVHYLVATAYNSEAVQVLYCPRSGRAGVGWGADAVWTDADSAEDALERYFGVDGKEMCN